MKTSGWAVAACLLLAGAAGAQTTGSTGFAPISPADETVVRRYVESTSVRPLALESQGEIRVGTVLPRTVQLQPVPGLQRYAIGVADGRILIIDPNEFRVVQIVSR
jgi:hypothetical protein